MKKKPSKSKSESLPPQLFSPPKKINKDVKSVPKSRSKSRKSLPNPPSDHRRTSKSSMKPPRGLDFTSKKTLDFTPKVEPPKTTTAGAAPLSVSDLRDLAASQIDRLKKLLSASHFGILKEADASKTRVSKKHKTHTQASIQLTEEVDKDYKKISDRLTEKAEVTKTGYVKIVSELQASTCHVSKVTIPELEQSMEKHIEGVRNRYNVEATPV